jgi:hypothetical protein
MEYSADVFYFEDSIFLPNGIFPEDSQEIPHFLSQKLDL